MLTQHISAGAVILPDVSLFKFTLTKDFLSWSATGYYIPSTLNSFHIVRHFCTRNVSSHATGNSCQSHNLGSFGYPHARFATLVSPLAHGKENNKFKNTHIFIFWFTWFNKELAIFREIRKSVCLLPLVALVDRPIRPPQQPTLHAEACYVLIRNWLVAKIGVSFDLNSTDVRTIAKQFSATFTAFCVLHRYYIHIHHETQALTEGSTIPIL